MKSYHSCGVGLIEGLIANVQTGIAAKRLRDIGLQCWQKGQIHTNNTIASSSGLKSYHSCGIGLIEGLIANGQAGIITECLRDIGSDAIRWNNFHWSMNSHQIIAQYHI